MDFTLEFFEYTKNCKEYQVLVKATSENATRKELKEGQDLFDKICTNSDLIYIKLSQIEHALVGRNIEIVKSVKEKNNPLKYDIKYKPFRGVDFDSNIKLSDWGCIEHHWVNYEIHEQKIREHLNPDFNHEEVKAEKKKWEEMKFEDKDKLGKFFHGVKLTGNSQHEMSIEESIKEFLQYYSNYSYLLMEYLELFIEFHTEE